MKRIFGLLLTVAVLFSMFAACAEQQTLPTSPEEQPTDPVVPTPDQTQVFDIQLTEVMADNQMLCLGHTLDWVEIHNGEDTAVSLNGYYLTNDPARPEEIPLSGLQIDSQDYLVVTLDETAPFHLSAVGGTVYLTCQGEVVSQLGFGASDFGESFDEDGVCEYPSPGYSNTEDGYIAYLEELELPELIISEVLSDNTAYTPISGEYYDFVELLNNSDAPLYLGDYALTDRWEKPARFYLPAITLQPGEYVLIYCSGDSSLGENHAPFKVSDGGETLYLTRNGEYVDSLTVPTDLKRNESYGRSGNIPLYLQKPTPGAVNSNGYRHGISAPQPDVVPGIYEQTVTVSLDAEGTIYYTLDGSRPTTKSEVYEKPLVIDGVTTIRCFCASDGRSSELTAYTYAVGADIHELPVVTVRIPQGYLTGSQGIFTNIYNRAEYEGVVSYFEEGKEAFCLPFGFCLHGNDSRRGEKKNFQIRFRSEYGATKVDYPLFENRDYTEYHSLVLKSGSEDWDSAMMRDELCTAIVEGNTSLYVLAMKPVVLYINGEYWGVYYLRERFSADYVASRLGGSADSVDLLKGSSGSVQAGSDDDFQALRTFALRNDMSKPENYQYLTEQVDLNSLMDWYICRSYMGDKDIGNIRRFRSKDADGKWKWMYYDLDWAFWHTKDNPLSSIANQEGKAEYALIQAVFESEQGRDAFLRRYAYLMDTVLNETYINSVIDTIVQAIESEMPRDRARWDRTVSSWETEVQRLRDYVNDGRRDRQVLKGLKSYFGLTDAEMNEYFGA